MASLKLTHVCLSLTVLLFSVGISSCRGQGAQDAIQIVAKAALCFDNRPVINGCLRAMGVNVSGSTNTSAPAPAAAGNGSTATMCSTPCFGQMTMMMDCLNGVLVNIQGYSPGLVQGVQAVFQMACGRGGAAAGAGASSGAGSSSVSSNSGPHVEVSSPGQPASGASGPMASLTGVFSTVQLVWAATGLMLFYL